jgi:hypothetical protein
MGQDVEIRNTATVGEVLVIDTDRSFTGQDGQAIGPELKGQGVPLQLAKRLFGLELGIDHVFVLQNAVTVRRPGGWDADTAEAVTETTHSFLRFYPDELAAAEEAEEQDTEAESSDEEDSEDSEDSAEEE